MIAKVNAGRGFKGVLQYVLDEEKIPEVVQYAGLPDSNNPLFLASNFIAIAEQNKKVEKPLWHFSISFAPEDIPKVDDELMASVTKDFLHKMGIFDNQYLAVKHGDTLHPHIHIVVNRVDFNGKCQADKMVKKRSVDAACYLEEKYDLSIAKKRSKIIQGKIKPRSYAFKPNEATIRRDMIRLIDHVHEQKPTSLEHFNNLLNNYGIALENRIDGKGNNYEIFTFSYDFTNNLDGKKRVSESARVLRSSLGSNHTVEFYRQMFQTNAHDSKEELNRATRIIKAFKKGNKTPGALKLIDHLIYQDINIIAESADQALKHEFNNEHYHEIKNKIENYFARDIDLKKQIKKGELDRIIFDQNLTFSFSKRDLDNIGNENLRKFYTEYLNGYGIKDDHLESFAHNKLLDSDSLNSLLNQVHRTNLTFNPLNVKHHILSPYLKIHQLKPKPLEAERNYLIQLSRIINNNELNTSDAIRFLNRRGVMLQKNKSYNFKLMKGDLDLGNPGAYALKKLTKHYADEFPENLETTFQSNYDSKRAELLKLIDENNYKAVFNRIKSSKSYANLLEEIDYKGVPASIRKSIKASISQQELRITKGIKK